MNCPDDWDGEHLYIDGLCTCGQESSNQSALQLALIQAELRLKDVGALPQTAYNEHGEFIDGVYYPWDRS